MIALAITVLIVVAVGFGTLLLWWRFRTLPPAALEPGWVARALVLAGDGVRGTRDGDAGRARFSEPYGLAVAADGTIYVADAGDANRIRGISPDGRVFTVAGGGHGFVDDVGEAARFSTPSGLAIDASGTLFVADTGNNVIRRITPDGRVSTYAGDGVAGDRDGPAHDARFNGPTGIAVDGAGRLIVADTYNDRIRAIDRDGTVSTLAGSTGSGWADGPATEARFHTPSGVAVGSSGRIFVADTGNDVVRVIDTAGTVTTAPWTYALYHPVGIAASPDGDVYVTDDRGRIIEASAAGVTRTLAGSTPGFRDGAGSDARFRSPAALAVTAPGRIVVADAGNALVRFLAAPSRLDGRPPASPRINPHFDAEGFGWQPLLWPVEPIEGPHEIAGTMGEVRGLNTERFHAGIDVRIGEGTAVHAIRDGVVSGVVSNGAFGTLTEFLRIGDLTYVHIRVGRKDRNGVFDLTRFVPTYEDGKLVGIRVKRGARFSTGELIGTVNAFNHVHLNVGWPGEEHNPLGFRLVQFEDTVAPTIAPRGVRLYDDHGQPLTTRVRGRLLVWGRVQMVIDAWDQANGNNPRRRLGLYDVGYQVLNHDGSPAAGFEKVRRTLRFNRLEQDPGAAAIVYAPGSGIPFYGGRRTQFLYRATSSLVDGVASEGFWDTSELPPGEYILRAWVADIRGNVATSNRDVPVTIISAAPDVSAHQ